MCVVCMCKCVRFSVGWVAVWGKHSIPLVPGRAGRDGWCACALARPVENVVILRQENDTVFGIVVSAVGLGAVVVAGVTKGRGSGATHL